MMRIINTSDDIRWMGAKPQGAPGGLIEQPGRCETNKPTATVESTLVWFKNIDVLFTFTPITPYIC